MTDKTTTNQQPQAPDYGEPWEVLSDRYDEYGYKDEGDYTFNIVRWNGCHEVNIDDETISHRIATCVNACAGIPSEDLTPSRVKKWMAMAKLVEAGDPAVLWNKREEVKMEIES